MSISPLDTPQRVAGWEPCACFTPVCKRNLLYVQRCDEQPDVWRVALSPGEAGWLIAAPAPLCPFCGGTLLIQTHAGADLAVLLSLS